MCKPPVLLVFLVLTFTHFNLIVNLKLHQPLNRFDLNDTDQFSNCASCLRLRCSSTATDDCELQTLFDPFEGDRVSFKLTASVKNQSAWLAIGFNTVKDMVC